MTALIIEDEIPAAKRLERLLAEKGFTVLAMLHSVKESVRYLTENAHPELIFMDIQLRDGLCFGIFDKVAIQSKVVFTTAFDDYALKAFDYNSLDYLLKPIDEGKLEKVLSKIDSFRHGFHDKNFWEQLGLQIENPYKASFLVNSGTLIRKFEAVNIPFFFSENNATYLCHEMRHFLINRSLEKLEAELDPALFFRINRKFIVNKRFISQVSNDFSITLNHSCPDLLKVSRQRKKPFLEWYRQ